MSAPAPALLHRELRRSFQTLEAQRGVWDRALAECGALLGSLGNLAVQLKAVRSVRLSESPLAAFPGLSERLQFKLSVAQDALLLRLSERMDVLQRARDAVGQQVSAVVQLYEENADALDLPACVCRSAVCPSVSDMLEWLQDADRHFRLQLVRRRTLLQTLTPRDLTLMETAPRRWEALRSSSGEERIADALCQVSFMESE